jgi:hypothetical protein
MCLMKEIDLLNPRQRQRPRRSISTYVFLCGLRDMDLDIQYDITYERCVPDIADPNLGSIRIQGSTLEPACCQHLSLTRNI